MDYYIITGLLQNASILLAFAILYGFFKIKNDTSKHYLNQIGIGVIIGIFGIFLISTPWIEIPGISFDTRSVLLSVSGLFFGPVPTFIAMFETGVYRIFLGGDGLIMGLVIIVTSGSVGLLWRHFRPDLEKGKYHLELFAMGIVVHVLMMLCSVLLPSEIVVKALKTIAFPVLVIYPLITVLLGAVIQYQFKSWKIKQELDISEKRWKFATEGVGDGVWDWNTKTNEVYYSKLWKEMLGYSETEIGHSFDEWVIRIHPDDKEQAESRLNKYLKGLIPEFKNELRLLCKDGSYKWIQTRGKVIERDNNGKPLRVIGTHTDISESKKAEAELQEINDKLQAFLNYSLDAILLTSPDGSIYSANPAACKMFELSEEEICKLGRNGIVDLNDPRLLKLTEERKKTGKASGELTMLKKGKKPFQVEISTAMFKNSEGFTFSSLIIRDITERINSQEIIRLNEERFRLISSVISDYMFESVISENGTTELVWTFGAFENITGYTPEEYRKNGGFRATIHPDDLQIDDKDLQKLKRNQNVITELRTFTKYDNVVWIRVYAYPVWDTENQKLKGIYGAVQDITERKIAEEKIRQLNEELEQKVEERTLELELKISQIERINRLFVGRELRMKELKEKIKLLEESQGNKIK